MGDGRWSSFMAGQSARIRLSISCYASARATVSAALESTVAGLEKVTGTGRVTSIKYHITYERFADDAIHIIKHSKLEKEDFVFVADVWGVERRFWHFRPAATSFDRGLYFVRTADCWESLGAFPVTYGNTFSAASSGILRPRVVAQRLRCACWARDGCFGSAGTLSTLRTLLQRRNVYRS